MFDPIPPELDELVRSVEPLHGWCPPSKAHDMAALVLRERPITVVEIGVFGGRSLLPQAYAVRHVGQGMVYGIDPWTLDAVEEAGAVDEAQHNWWRTLDLEEIYQDFVGNVDKRGLSDWVTVLKTSSECAVSGFADGQIDILHIDGNHTEQVSTRDIRLYLPKLRPGGFLWLDDTNWDSLKPAVALLDEVRMEMLKDYGAFRLYRKPREAS